MNFRARFLILSLLFVLFQGSVHTEVAAPEKKLSFAEKAKAAAAAAAEKAKKAAAAAVEKAKKAAAAAVEKAKIAAAKAVADAKKQAEIMGKIGKQAAEELKKMPAVFAERIKKLSFKDTQIDLTFPMKIEMPAPAPVAGATSVPESKTLDVILGITYPLPSGYGDISSGLTSSKGVFSPEKIYGIPVSMVLPLLQAAPGVGDLLRKVSTLSPQTVFLLKVVALANDAQAKKLSPVDVATNLNFLLARLAQTPSIKGISDLFAVLPDFLEKVVKDILNAIKLPISSQELQAFTDRQGKPVSEMEKAVSLMRWTLGYNARLAVAREKVIPLITAASLTLSDKELLGYHLKRLVYDLDKGFESYDPPAAVAKIIGRRADDLLTLLDTCSVRIREAQFSTQQQSVIEELRALVRTVKETKKVVMPRPEFGGTAKQDVSFDTYLNVQFFVLKRDILQKKFEEDGSFEEGKGEYLFDDSFLSKDQAKKYMMAVLFRCVKEKNNDKFDLLSFLKNELSSFLYVRIDPGYRQELFKLIQPFTALFNKMQGFAKAAQAKAAAAAQKAASTAEKVGASDMTDAADAGLTGPGEMMVSMAEQAKQDALDEQIDSLLDEQDFKLLGLESDEDTGVSDAASEAPVEEVSVPEPVLEKDLVVDEVSVAEEAPTGKAEPVPDEVPVAEEAIA